MFRKWLNAISESFWAIPLTMVGVGLGLTLPEVEQLRFLHPWLVHVQIRVETVTTILTVLASSLITMAGTIFSITIVSLSLASQQFGPRLLRTFMNDRMTQLTLGAFVSGTAFCLANIIAVPTDIEYVGLIGLIALIYCLGCLVLMVLFFDHLTKKIQAPEIVQAVYCDLERVINRYCKHENVEPQGSWSVPSETTLVASEHQGYVQSIDTDGLLKLAAKYQVQLEVLVKLGDFVTYDTNILRYGPHNDDVEAKLKEEQSRHFVLGKRRRLIQDIGAAFDELTELAVRSLSPGINDPYTAVQCIHHLESAISCLLELHLPQQYYADSLGSLRLRVRRRSRAEFVRSTISQIRPYCITSLMASEELLMCVLRLRNKTRESEVLKVSALK